MSDDYMVDARHVALRGRFADGSVLVETKTFMRGARVHVLSGHYQKVHRHKVHRAGAAWADIARAVDALPELVFANDPDAGTPARTSPRPSPPVGGHYARPPGARLHAHFALKTEED